MIKSVNQIRLELAEIQSNHLQLSSFYWGDFLTAYKENELNYPLMGAFYPSGSFLRNQTQIQLTIYVADKLYDSWSNLNEVESDTLQICRDIFQVINSSVRWQTIGKVQSCTVTKFIDKGGDGVAGHQMVFQFAMRDRDGICNLPMENYDFNEQIGDVCLPVQIYENGILVDTIASGGMYSYTTDVFTYTIKNTALTSLYSGNVTANLDVTITDSTAVIKNTLGTTLITESILAQSSEVITAPNGTAKNSDNTYSVAVPSGATVTMPDISFTDSDGTVTSVPSNKNITAALCGAAASVGMKLMKTGQTVSYRTGDDGDFEAGRATSFTVLASNNPFGNTNRFTDELGGTIYTNNIVIDWSTFDGSTVFGVERIANGNFNWNTNIDNAIAHSVGIFTTGWRLPNIREIENLALMSSVYSTSLNYPPLNLSTAGYYHCSTSYRASPSASTYTFNNVTGQSDVNSKANYANSFRCRTFTVVGTTLS